MKERSLFGFDFLMFMATVALIVIGVLFIYSSGVTSSGEVLSNEYLKQIVWASVGIIALFALVLYDYENLRRISRYLYAFFIVMLIITLAFGKVVNGARSWLAIGSLNIGQPSEFAKVATILFLASYLERTDNQADRLSRFLIAFAIVLLPMLLILAQPDMGTALVYVPIFLFVAFASGTKIRYVAFIIISAAFLILLSLLPSLERYGSYRDGSLVPILIDPTFLRYSLLTLMAVAAIAASGYAILKRNYLYWILYSTLTLVLGVAGSMGARILLKEYQLSRLVVFVNPEVDPQGAGWNVIQSVTAVGSGGFLGKGFLKGTQSHYRFLPQQSTDFIFSIISEEWGFIGGAVIFLLFAIILVRGLIILTTAKDSFGIYAGAGIVGMIFFHAFINIGMAMGIMPITGIPLFFLSYGGSSLWTALIGIAFLLNIHIRRYKY